MNVGEYGVTYLSMPPNLQTDENYALGAAFDSQMKKLMAFYGKLKLWPSMENLDSRYYDYAAASIRTPYYSSEYDDETRLSILLSAFQTYRYAGTVRAIDELLQSIFTDAQFVPWYDYSGEPYHFKIVCSTDPTDDMVEKFATILSKVKAQRSIIDRIETPTKNIDMSIYLARYIDPQEKAVEEDEA